MTQISTQAIVRDAILDRMLTTKLEPGDRLSLPTLARKLGTSVTPVREVCQQLSYSGLIGYEVNCGFAVNPLSTTDARLIYSTVAALEAEAMRQAKPGSINIALLRDINQEFELTQGAEQRFRIDMKFHKQLTSAYKGTHVEKLLEDLRVRIYMYERNYLMRAESIHESVHVHTRIVECLASGRREDAIVALRQNWLNFDPALAAAGLVC